MMLFAHIISGFLQMEVNLSNPLKFQLFSKFSNHLDIIEKYFVVVRSVIELIRYMKPVMQIASSIGSILWFPYNANIEALLILVEKVVLKKTMKISIF